jgi:hypothetical protein
MAIFYLPYLDPATGLSVTTPPAAKLYAYGDIYVSSAGAPYFRNGPPTGTLVTWTKYVSNVGPGTLGLAYSSTVPPLISSALVTTKNLNVNQTVDFDIGSVYGGSAITSSFAAGGTVTGLSATISPALPSGLTLNKVFSTVTIGANVYNSLKLSITGAATAVTPLTSYKITIKDATNLSASLSFDLSTTSVSLLNVTQAVPSKIETVGVAEDGFTPVVASGGSGALTYTISPALPTGFTINSSTGEITGTGTVASAVTSYTVTVTDSASPPQSKFESFSLSVVSVPIVAKTVIPTKVLQQSIAATSFTPVTATGGTGTLTFTVSPTLPAGLSFSSSGAITGTPTASSASTLYTVTVKDSSPIPLTATASFALSVDALAALVTTQVVPTTTLTKNIAATSFTPVTASGGYGTLTYAVSPALPAGLSFSTTTGAISGTPTGTSVSTSYTVTVTDQGSQSSSKTFLLSVSVTALTVTLDIPSKIVTSNVAVAMGALLCFESCI